MAKNSFLLRIVFYIGIALLGSSCTRVITEPEIYYRYSIGQMIIKNPVVINIYGSGDSQYYVCADSVVPYWRDTNWVKRKDVFLFEFAPQFVRNKMPEFYRGECFVQNYAIFYTSITHMWHRIFDPISSFCPYYTYEEIYDSIQGMYVSFSKLYYDIEVFDTFMQGVGGYYYDPSDPFFQDPWADCYDAFTFSNQYRLVVCPHFTPLQIFKLRKKYRQKQANLQNTFINNETIYYSSHDCSRYLRLNSGRKHYRQFIGVAIKALYRQF